VTTLDRPLRPGHLAGGAARAFWLGALVFLSAMLLFGFAAETTGRGGYLAPVLARNFVPDPEAAALAGQWLVGALLALIRLIPGAGPEVLVLLTVTAMAAGLGVFAAGLRRRGWPETAAGAAAVLLALHPLTLRLATTGTALPLAIGALALLVLSLDRAEAVGDARSLMEFGLALALLFVTTPNAIYYALPTLVLLPGALRDIRSTLSAVALYILVLVPPLVTVSAIVLGGLTLGVPAAALAALWAAPMHGAVELAAASPWLARHGGSVFSALAAFVALGVVCLPGVLLPTLKLFGRRERSHPVTALAVLAHVPIEPIRESASATRA
jgi:hypothetical protein